VTNSVNNRSASLRHWSTVLGFLAATASITASAAIAPEERQVLLDLYASAGGAGWTNNTGWNDVAGTECTWAGIACNGTGDHVMGIALAANNLVGTLPAINALSQLSNFNVAQNMLSGALPSLTGLVSLQTLYFSSNQFSGSMPDLSGLASLQIIDMNGAGVSGTIPSLAGLTSLQSFEAPNNNLTGSLPSLEGLASLSNFNVDTNQLTGTIPALAGLPNLTGFNVSHNPITGSIPPLPNTLVDFMAGGTQLSGPLPDLSGLTALAHLWVNDDQLSGTVPDLSNLQSLISFLIEGNQFTGVLPDPPPGLNTAGSAVVCPNGFQHIDNAAWDIAVGVTPWWSGCAPTPVTLQEFGVD